MMAMQRFLPIPMMDGSSSPRESCENLVPSSLHLSQTVRKRLEPISPLTDSRKKLQKPFNFQKLMDAHSLEKRMSGYHSKHGTVCELSNPEKADALPTPGRTEGHQRSHVNGGKMSSTVHQHLCLDTITN
uniref:Uncharacterized protein n=1 Tax=Molossus molossus TaxID=27622 RepID=A0A7J8HHD3_MOLMO|nr:hypothetical protein HJG59_011054 [Molossus molossus]